MAVIALVLVLMFGAKKLPDAARSLGKSMRIFKSEIREMQAEGKPEPPSIDPPQPVQSQRVDPPAPTEQGHHEARPLF
jgi:sec-independent protein translocase protein TatA